MYNYDPELVTHKMSKQAGRAFKEWWRQCPSYGKAMLVAVDSGQAYKMGFIAGYKASMVDNIPEESEKNESLIVTN